MNYYNEINNELINNEVNRNNGGSVAKFII